MSRYDVGARLAAEAVHLLGARVPGTALTEYDVQVVLGQVPGAVAQQAAPAKPTLLEKLEKEATDLEAGLAAVSAQLAKRKAQIEELKRYPQDDPYADDTVLRFKKAFRSDPNKKYSYTASREEGLWYVSGEKAPNGVEWPELVSFMGLGVTDIIKLAPGRAARVAWSEVK